MLRFSSSSPVSQLNCRSQNSTRRYNQVSISAYVPRPSILYSSPYHQGITLTPGHLETFPASETAARVVSVTLESGESKGTEEGNAESMSYVNTPPELTVCSFF